MWWLKIFNKQNTSWGTSSLVCSKIMRILLLMTLADASALQAACKCADEGLFIWMQAQKAAIKAQRKAMDEMFQAMKRTYSELNSEQAELESALGSITARSLRSQPTPPAAMLSAMRSLPVLGLLTGKISTSLMLSTCFAA